MMSVTAYTGIPRKFVTKKVRQNLKKFEKSFPLFNPMTDVVFKNSKQQKAILKATSLKFFFLNR